MHSDYVVINKSLYQLVVNCLKRDAEEGKQSRKEILEEIENNAKSLDNYIEEHTITEQPTVR